MRTTRMWVSLLFALGLFSGMGLSTSSVAQAQTTHNVTVTPAPVQLQVTGMTATISNGIYTIMFNSNGTGYSLVWQGKELIGPGRQPISYVVIWWHTVWRWTFPSIRLMHRVS